MEHWRIEDTEDGDRVLTNGENSVSFYDASTTTKNTLQLAENMVTAAERNLRDTREFFERIVFMAYADTKQKKQREA